ncbi:MAG: proton-dependent oligopeptide transporter, family [Acidobacteriota bacterium]|nr:proton-dependent oligopeptide transporter, family [Acidobacteriota bacterium]
MNDEKVQKSFGEVLKDAFKELGETLVAFVKAPRALWGINLPYIIEGLCYFGLIYILTTYCYENVKLNDIHSGWVVGGVTWGITLAMLFLGGVVDRIGVRLALGLSLALMAGATAIVALSGTIPLGSGMGSPMFFVMAGGLFIMVLGYGVYQPAAYAGVKRYTNPQTAAVAYAVIYALMNLGGFIFGPISSFSRRHLTDVFPPNGIAGVIWILAILTVVSSALTFIIINRKVDASAVARVKKETEEMEKAAGKIKKEEDTDAAAKKEEKPADQKINHLPFILYSLLTAAAAALLIAVIAKKIEFPILVPALLLAFGLIISTWEYLRKRPDHPFRDMRFVFFIFILIPVQTLFAHQWLTIPLYLKRGYEGTMVSEYFEIFGNLNPLLIFILAPLIAGLTARTDIYRMVILGTLVMAIPTFLLAIGTNAWLYLFYVILMTTGEAMWQPRFLQWVAEIAPEGKTGIYMGIGQFPWFLTKMITSIYSGYFLSKYVPDPALGLKQNPEQMWFLYGLIAMISPLALILARKWMLKGMRQKSQ